MRNMKPPFKFDLRDLLTKARQLINDRVSGVSIRLPFLTFSVQPVKVSLTDQEDDGCAEGQDEKRIPDEPIDELFPSRRGLVFLGGQCPDISYTASIEVSHGIVVHRVRAAPLFEGREGQDAGDISQDPVCPRRTQE